MNVLDASALLAFLQGEDGAEVVERVLADDARCASVNWSETAQKILSHGRDWDLARTLLLGFGLVVEPVTRDDAEAAARMWSAGSGLSLGDRLCLALGERLGAVVWTADRAWDGRTGVRQVR